MEGRTAIPSSLRTVLKLFQVRLMGRDHGMEGEFEAEGAFHLSAEKKLLLHLTSKCFRDTGYPAHHVPPFTKLSPRVWAMFLEKGHRRRRG